MGESGQTCVLIPAYNAQETVGPIIAGVREVTPRSSIVVIDDGSTDETAGRARAAGAGLLDLRRNRGKGHALVAGFRHALELGCDQIVTMDADGQHHPADLPLMLQRAGNVDAALVIGQRRLDLQNMPRSSFAGNCISTFWISLFCGRQFPDTQCGFRVYSRRLLQSVPLRGGRFETETEILMRAALLGLRLEWVPIRTIYDNGITPHVTNFDTFFDSLRVIGVVLRSPRFPRGA